MGRDAQSVTISPISLSCSCLIAMALKNSKTGSLPVSEIYSFMKEHFPYFKVTPDGGGRTLQTLGSRLVSLTSPCLFQTAPDGWKNSVRHNLSLNKCFEKVENKMSGTSRKGCLWALNPAKIDKMEEEMQKWKRKDLAAIHRSMANPGGARVRAVRGGTALWPGVRPSWTEPAGTGLSRPATAASSGLLGWNTPRPALTGVAAVPRCATGRYTAAGGGRGLTAGFGGAQCTSAPGSHPGGCCLPPC